MLAPRVAIDFALILGLGFGASFAKAEDRAPAKARGRESRDGKTVGDLLKRIESNTKKVQFAKSSSSLPSFNKIEGTRPKSVNLTQVKPPSRSTLYYEEGTNEAELEKVTDQGINQLYKLTQQFKGSKRRGELWLRLAEHYVEKARLIEYRLQQQHDEKIAAFQSGKSKQKPVLNLKPAQDYNRKSIQLYEWFLRDFPNDSKLDQAYFFLGYNYFELEQPDKGKDYYKRLTSERPKSPFVEESNFALGEYYFDREDWANALKYYSAVAANKKARLYSFALYKTAWCEYKTGAVKKALASLERVIRSGRVAKGSQDNSAGGASRIRLATEAQKDLVVFYAEGGTAENARAYFEEVAGGKHTFSLLEKLAYYYADTGNRDGARFLFRELIQERPNAPKAYDYQYQIVTMYTSTDKGEVFKSELYSWIQNYSPESEWAKVNGKDKDLVAKAHQLIETTLRNHILQQHQTAQNSRVPAAQKAAKAGYELYFQTFKEGAKLDEMHFFYAELLFDMGEYSLAALHYTWVVENAPKGVYFEKASLNSILALEKSLPKEDELKKQVGDRLEPVQFSANVQAFTVATDRYVKQFPKGENVPAMKYKVGALYYYHNQFDRALEVFNSIIKDYPKSPYAQYSANLTLDIYNLRKDYGGLEKAGQDILQNEDLAKSQVGSQVKGVLQRASFKKAQDLEAKGDFAGAAVAYEDFTKKNAGGDLGVSAAFNAAVNFEKSGDSGKAIQMYGIVLADSSNKNADLKLKSSQFVASLYERTGQYQKAAEAYEKFSAVNPKDKNSLPFLFNAALIRDGMNSYNQALANYEKYSGLSRGSEKFEAIFLMAKVWERRGNLNKAHELYKQYYDARPKNASGLIEAAFMVASIHTKKKKHNEAEEWYKKVIYQQKTLSKPENPIGVGFAAEAKYTLVSKTFDELRSIRIPANPAKQGQAVQEKLARLNRLKEQLKDVIRYDDAYMVVNSLSLIGQAYQHMAASIYAVPLPKGLDEEGLKQYKAGVDKVAQPFTDEAIKNYEAAIEKGFKLEGFNDGLKAAQHELNRLNKARFPNFGEKAMVTRMPDMIGLEADEGLAAGYKAKDEKLMIENVSRILSKDQNDLKALNALVVFYIDQNKSGLASLIANRALKAHPVEVGLHNNLGVIYLLQGKQRPAIASFKKAIEIKSSYAIGASNLGSIFVEYRDYARAVEYLSGGYGAVKTDLRKGLGLDVANNYALALSGSGQFDKAKSIFQDILKVEGQNTTALLNYAILLVHHLKDKKEGEKTLNRLKFLADDNGVRARVDELEKALNEN